MDSRDTLPALWSGIGTAQVGAAGENQITTASELMFFGGAPLAHVVAYGEHLRMERIARRNQACSRRICGLRSRPAERVYAGWKSVC